MSNLEMTSISVISDFTVILSSEKNSCFRWVSLTFWSVLRKLLKWRNGISQKSLLFVNELGRFVLQSSPFSNESAFARQICASQHSCLSPNFTLLPLRTWCAITFHLSFRSEAVSWVTLHTWVLTRKRGYRPVNRRAGLRMFYVEVTIKHFLDSSPL